MASILFFLALLGLAYGFGRWAEHSHFRSLQKRERLYAGILIVTERRLPDLPTPVRTDLVVGHVVVSTDYFKRFIATLNGIIGGRIRSYETVLERGRREAILRLKEAAAKKGAEAIFGVRLETASLFRSDDRTSDIGCVEVFAYGTAVIRVHRGTDTSDLDSSFMGARSRGLIKLFSMYLNTFWISGCG